MTITTIYKKLLLLLCLGLSVATYADKPNIILLFADDISPRELPIYGSTVWSLPKGGGLAGGDTSDPKYRAKTPVLDKIAQEGCYFKTAWAATVCGPSRAMMMTGRYAHLHKWWHNKGKGKSPEGASVWNLYESSPHTIGHVAKAGGYSTYWAGKTQMEDVRNFAFDEGCLVPGSGSHNKAIPTTDFRLENQKDGSGNWKKNTDGSRKLFNADNNAEVDSYVQSGWYWYPHVQLMFHPDETEDLVWWPTNDNHTAAKDTFGVNTYGPDVELEFIFEFMERKHKEDEPFFIYHTSHLGHDAWDFLFHDEANKWPGTPKVSWDGSKYTRTKPNITGDNGVYDTHGTVTEDGIHTHVNYLDYQVWLYMNKLKELGIENETIFIFSADNGTSGYGKSLNDSQKGTHVPMIIYAPGLGMTKTGEQEEMVNISDMLPTIADLAGVKIPDDYEINGTSLYRYLFTNQKTTREWVYGYHKETQLIRGEYVLLDGRGNWYDVKGNPNDLISFTKIEDADWASLSEEHRKEKAELEAIIPDYSQEKSGIDAPAGGFDEPADLRELTAEEIETLNKPVLETPDEGNEQGLSVNNKLLDVRVYPNPTQGTLNIRGVSPGADYKIYDNRGVELVESYLNMGASIDVSAFDAGIYFISLEGIMIKFKISD
ncbi:sulfatase-like hydrolase/transferase [Reichenbachiella versicolor]|uniref:sulfatase-like hydrolase/transferase n=1 Tax=Reichenbachiella versicolor TaxID=1821036 RepID=UPI0013A5538D|nr:sulfatase-like hydrolase/transferase [Reichenbachiella versicolor]